MFKNLSNPKLCENDAILNMMMRNVSGQLNELAAVNVASVSGLFASFKYQSSCSSLFLAIRQFVFDRCLI